MKPAAPQQTGFKQDIDKLVELGKKKGFLTYTEVNETLSDEVHSSEEIDKVFDILDGKDIKVIEEAEEEEGELTDKLDEESREQEIRRVREEAREEEVYSDKFIPLDDPVKMYLKQMGSIPLLSRENEISLARRIEEAEIRFAEALYKIEAIGLPTGGQNCLWSLATSCTMGQSVPIAAAAPLSPWISSSEEPSRRPAHGAGHAGRDDAPV